MNQTETKTVLLRKPDLLYRICTDYLNSLGCPRYEPLELKQYIAEKRYKLLAKGSARPRFAIKPKKIVRVPIKEVEAWARGFLDQKTADRG